MKHAKPKSITANYVAAFRSLATEDPKFKNLINDPWAKQFAGKDGFDRVKEVDIHNKVYETVVLRSIFIDAWMKRLVTGRQIKQVVILGAGFDARSARFPFPGVQYYEIDHAASHLAKTAAVKSAVGYPTANCKYLVHDFESQQSFIKTLVDAGLKTSEPILFIWEGVTMYLTAKSVLATLKSMADCGQNVFVIFDYFTRQIRSAHENEPFKWYSHKPTDIVAAAGFTYCRNTVLDDYYLNLFGEYKPYTASGIAVATNAAKNIEIDHHFI